MGKLFLMEWRKNFNGPVCFKKGDLVWSTVRSKVSDGMEFFILEIPKANPEFSRLNETFRDINNKDWDGQYLVPCSYIRFAEEKTAVNEKDIPF